MYSGTKLLIIRMVTMDRYVSYPYPYPQIDVFNLPTLGCPIATVRTRGTAEYSLEVTAASFRVIVRSAADRRPVTSAARDHRVAVAKGLD